MTLALGACDRAARNEFYRAIELLDAAYAIDGTLTLAHLSHTRHFHRHARSALGEILEHQRLNATYLEEVQRRLQRWEDTAIPPRDALEAMFLANQDDHFERQFFLRMRTRSPFHYLGTQCFYKPALVEVQRRLIRSAMSKSTWRKRFAHWEESRSQAAAMAPVGRQLRGLIRAPLRGKLQHDTVQLARAFTYTVGDLASVMRDLTWLRLLRAYSSVCLYRQETGKWPEGWGALVPKYLEKRPIDPSAGRAFRIGQSSGQGFVQVVGGGHHSIWSSEPPRLSMDRVGSDRE